MMLNCFFRPNERLERAVRDLMAARRRRAMADRSVLFLRVFGMLRPMRVGRQREAMDGDRIALFGVIVDGRLVRNVALGRYWQN